MSSKGKQKEGEMSLRKDPKLIQIINETTRTLRRNSTSAERILQEHLRNRKFFGCKFYRQYPIIFDIEGKETFFVLDFYCHKQRIAVEVDGGIHKTKVEEDKRRESILNKMGIQVLRLKNEEVENNLDESLCKLKEVLNLNTNH